MRRLGETDPPTQALAAAVVTPRLQLTLSYQSHSWVMLTLKLNARGLSVRVTSCSARAGCPCVSRTSHSAPPTQRQRNPAHVSPY